MPEQPRNKGQFMQAGMISIYPAIGGSVVSHDGTLEMDTVYLQEDFPVLFQVIGVEYNDAGKGDDPATQFRTPTADDLPTLGAGYAYRIRF